MVMFCEYGNEHWGFEISWEFPHYLNHRELLEKGLSVARSYL